MKPRNFCLHAIGACILTLCYSSFLYTQNTATLSIGSSEAEIGEQVSAPITADIPGKFHTFQFRITYNPAVLRAGEISNFHPAINGLISHINNELGFITFNFLSFTPVNLSLNTKLFDLVFDFCTDFGACQQAGFMSNVSFDPNYANQIADFDAFFNPIYYDLSLIDGSVWGAVPISGYTVSFLITDTEANPINNASVTLGNQTNDPGEYVFIYVEEGQYTYTVAAEGYETAEGVLDVFDDIELEIMLQESDSSIIYLQNIIVTNGETKCYDAMEAIIVAGNGSCFLMESGSTVHMLAGQRIVFRAGAKLDAGSYLLASINPDFPYCAHDAPLAIENTIDLDEKTNESDGLPKLRLDSNKPFIINIYPNPGKDIFTLEFASEQPTGMITLEVFNIRGALIKKKEIINGQNHIFHLEKQPKGIFFLRVTSGDNTETIRFIKN